MRRMNIYLVIGTAFGISLIPLFIAAEHCSQYSLSMSYEGRYCPGDGTVTPHLLPHQCRYICVHSNNFRAYNYNATEGTCTRFTSPCPEAFPDTMMEFAVFTEKPIDQCYRWITYSSGDVVDPRMISTGEQKLLICRMQKDGSDRMGHFHTIRRVCYSCRGSSVFNSRSGYLCQRLRIMEECTIFWVPYTAQDPIHPRAAIGGHMVNGDVVYITKFDYNGLSLAGHYVEGATFATTPYGGVAQRSSTMMMMVIL